MPSEFSSGAVVFRKERNKIVYLLLHYGKGHWDFPKGHIEKGETEEETAIREAKEETGIEDLKFLDGFKEKIEYFFRQEGKTIHKMVIYFLAETKTKDIKISFEHSGFEWLDYEKALEKITFNNSREILKKAHSHLIKS